MMGCRALNHLNNDARDIHNVTSNKHAQFTNHSQLHKLEHAISLSYKKPTLLYLLLSDQRCTERPEQRSFWYNIEVVVQAIFTSAYNIKRRVKTVFLSIRKSSLR